METSGQINCPAPLPKDTADALLTEVLTPAPYKVPEKTKKAKGTRKSSRRQGLSDLSSDNSAAHSSPEDEEEDEDSPPPVGGDKKTKVAPTGGRRVQEGKDSPSGLLHHRRRRRRRVAALGQAHGEVVSIRIPE